MARLFGWLVLVILLSGLLGFVINLPEDAGEDVPAGKLNSLSFAPFRDGQSPLLQQFPSPEDIEADLILLADKTHTIRTYSITKGMRAIPELAQKHHLKMILGGWVNGYEPEETQAEMAGLIQAANAYPDTVKRVIVGNEVLLRGEMAADELIKHIRMVKQAVKQPVSYADVWSRYMEHPELIKEVDFITIHILPYWEDEPIPVDEAPAHIERIYRQVKAEAERIAPGKPILIGETGWPSEGRQRGQALPSVVNEAAFIRALLKVAKENSFDVNIVEAFNQSWKSELEGVIGANWGLYSADRNLVFPLTGKVYENQQWLTQFLIAAGLTLLVAVFYARRLAELSQVKLFLWLLFCQIVLWQWVYQTDKSWYTSYDNWQRIISLTVTGLNLILIGLLTCRLLDVLTKITTSKRVVNGLKLTYLLATAGAVYKTYGLAVDGRYISFPFEILTIAVFGIVGLSLAIGITQRPLSWGKQHFVNLIGDENGRTLPYRHIACLLIFYAFGLFVGEFKAFMMGGDLIKAHAGWLDRVNLSLWYTFSNCQLLLWVLCLSVVAFSCLVAVKSKSN